MKKPTCTLYGGHSPLYPSVHVGSFIHTSMKGKNQESILIIQFQIIFMQHLRENSFEIKRNLN